MLLTRLRTAKTVASAALAPRANISRISMRVHWVDCDLNRHMTNSRYLGMMDVGRWDLSVRSGLWRMFRDGLRPTVVEVALRFRRELRPGQRFTLDTRVTGFRGKAMLIEQTFLVGREVHARAEVANLLRDGRRVVPPDPVRPFVTPPLALTAAWQVADHGDDGS